MVRAILLAFHFRLRLRVNGDGMVVKNAMATRDIVIFSNTLDTSGNLLLINCETRREKKVSSMAKESKNKEGNRELGMLRSKAGEQGGVLNECEGISLNISLVIVIIGCNETLTGHPFYPVAEANKPFYIFGSFGNDHMADARRGLVFSV
ncbi:hypothetical protein Peur_058912 [Populus x canadensis]